MGLMGLLLGLLGLLLGLLGLVGALGPVDLSCPSLLRDSEGGSGAGRLYLRG